MNETIRLSFLTDQDKIVTMRVARANPAVTVSQINNAMDGIIDSTAFDTNGRGNVIAKHSAELVVTTTTHFDVV